MRRKYCSSSRHRRSSIRSSLRFLRSGQRGGVSVTKPTWANRGSCIIARILSSPISPLRMVSRVFPPRVMMEQRPHGYKDLPTNGNVRVLLLATGCGAVRDVHAHHILCAEDVDDPLLEQADAGNSGQISAHGVNVANVEAELDTVTIPAERSYGPKLLN